MAEATNDPLVGQNLGAFHVEQFLATSRWGPVYRAVQTGVNRTVALRLLHPDLADAPGNTERFTEEVQAEARISHPNIVATFEAGQVEGIHFCAMEYMDGSPLAEFLRGRFGGGVNEHHLLTAIAAAAQALDYLWTHKIAHRPPEASNLLVDAAGAVKMLHVLPVAKPSDSPRADAAALGATLAHFANSIGPVSRSIGELVERLLGTAGRKPFATLAEVATAAQELDLKLFPPAALPQSAIPKIQPKKTSPLVVGATGLVLAALVGVVVWQVMSLRKTKKPALARPADIGTMVAVPAGEFIYQTGEKKTLPAFYIDKYEVTMAEYNQFLDALAKGAKLKEHPRSIKTNHTPLNWDRMLAIIGQEGVLTVGDKDMWLTWDSAVFGIDWYDAYAYAAWRGKRLPTEEEWEKAARGTNGFLYPWGNEPDAAKANMNDRSHRLEVYAFPDDKSPFGVIGMAGNVSEWTASGARDTAVVRGGSWQQPEITLTNRWPDRRREARLPDLGFRCAADQDGH